MILNESLNVVCLVLITTRHIATKETLPEPGNEPIENERIQFPMYHSTAYQKRNLAGPPALNITRPVVPYHIRYHIISTSVKIYGGLHVLCAFAIIVHNPPPPPGCFNPCLTFGFSFRICIQSKQKHSSLNLSFHSLLARVRQSP